LDGVVREHLTETAHKLLDNVLTEEITTHSTTSWLVALFVQVHLLPFVCGGIWSCDETTSSGSGGGLVDDSVRKLRKQWRVRENFVESFGNGGGSVD